MSDSVWPHRQQPTRLPRPWNSPGKNTGGGCHFLLQCMRAKSESEVAQSCPTLSDPMDCSLLGSSVHGILQARVLEWFSNINAIFSIFFFFSRISTIQPYKYYWSRGIYLAQNHLYNKSPCPLTSPKTMSIWRRGSNYKRLCALFLMGAEREEVKSQSQTWMEMDPYDSILSNVKVPKSYTNTQFKYC